MIAWKHVLGSYHYSNVCYDFRFDNNDNYKDNDTNNNDDNFSFTHQSIAVIQNLHIEIYYLSKMETKICRITEKPNVTL